MANEQYAAVEDATYPTSTGHNDDDSQKRSRIKLTTALFLASLTLIATTVIVGTTVAWPLAITIGAAALFCFIGLWGVLQIIEPIFNKIFNKDRLNILFFLIAVVKDLTYSAKNRDSIQLPSFRLPSLTKFYIWCLRAAYKLSFALTAFALAIFPILIVTAVMPVSMLGIVTFGGFGAMIVSVGFLVALPLLATVVFYVMQYDKEGGWLQKPAVFLRKLIATHKTQIVFWALATAAVAVLLTLLLPLLAIPGLTTTTTLILIIAVASTGIAIGEFVTLQVITNLVVRWVLALMGGRHTAKDNNFVNNALKPLLVCATAAVTGAPRKAHKDILDGKWHWKGPFVVADKAEVATDRTDFSEGCTDATVVTN